MNPSYYSLALLAAGLLVVVIELFIPSAGALGILAGALIIGSIVMGFYDSVNSGLLVLALAIVSLPAILALMVHVWPHTPLGKRILLDERDEDDILPPPNERWSRLAGQVGIAKTKMLPSGTVLINGEKFDAVSDGFPIESGDPIVVIEVRENRIYVQPFDGTLPQADEKTDPSKELGDADLLAQPIEELGLDGLEDPLGS